MKHNVRKESMEAVRRQLEAWGSSIEPLQQESLAFYAEKLAAYEKANVIGTRDISGLWLDHILDSLSCLLHGPIRTAASLIDVGSGGGMPGLPLRLAVGFGKTCLLESIGKKAEFLRYVTGELGLEDIDIANGRAEDLGQNSAYRDSFEVATVRAVASLGVISEYCLPFLAIGGSMIAMKSRISSEELESGKQAANVLGGELEEIIHVPFLPEIEPKERCLVVIKKVSHTPKSYPRRPGVPRKHPIESVR